MVGGNVPYEERAHTLARWKFVTLVTLAAIALTLVSYGLRDSQAAIPVEQVSCGAQSQSVWVILRAGNEAVDSYDANTLNMADCMVDREADLVRGTPTPVYEHGLGEPMAMH